MSENINLVIRYVEAKDSQQILNWRNHPVAIKQSIHPSAISEHEHKEWFDHAIDNPLTHIFICDKVLSADQFQSIGMVRFDINQPQSEASVSINIASDFHHQGYGTECLRKAIAEFTKDHTVALKAQIKPDNLASLRCFKKNDFVIYETNYQLIELKNKIVIIDAIEKVRSNNNVNWMDIMRVALRSSPKEAEKIIARIHKDDGQINKLLKMLGDQ